MSEGLNGTAQAGLGVSPHDSAGNGVSHGVERDARDSNGGGRDVDRGVTPIPASIVRAICQIKSTVEAVKKTQKNSHGGYMFSSTDDIYAAISRKMGDVGVICLAMEEESKFERVEKDGKTSQWLRVVYSFVWATETDTWTDPRARRTLCVLVTGPQTFQAAQSFAEKSYYRSTFKIPSGDMDLDSMPQADNEEDQHDLLAPRKRKSSAAAKRDGTDVVFNELRGAVSGADGPADLELIKRNNWQTWESLPPAWRKILDAEFEDKMAEFESEPA